MNKLILFFLLKIKKMFIYIYKLFLYIVFIFNKNIFNEVKKL